MLFLLVVLLFLAVLHHLQQTTPPTTAQAFTPTTKTNTHKHACATCGMDLYFVLLLLLLQWCCWCVDFVGGVVVVVGGITPHHLQHTTPPTTAQAPTATINTNTHKHACKTFGMDRCFVLLLLLLLEWCGRCVVFLGVVVVGGITPPITNNTSNTCTSTGTNNQHVIRSHFVSRASSGT